MVRLFEGIYSRRLPEYGYEGDYIITKRVKVYRWHRQEWVKCKTGPQFIFLNKETGNKYFIDRRSKKAWPLIKRRFSAEKVLWDFGNELQSTALGFRDLDEDETAIIPGPLIKANVGDLITVDFTNNLPPNSKNDQNPCLSDGRIFTKSTSIHWHGIEVNNRSDGTPVTQNPVLREYTYRYRYIFPRPGIFWYHPHFTPLDQVFQGMYAPIIVEDCADKILTKIGVIPSRSTIVTLASVTIEDGKIKFMEESMGEDAFGKTFVINGKVTPTNIDVKSGEGIRIRVLNLDIFRYYLLKFFDGNGDQQTIFRIGGEGGLLDNVRVEGGMLGDFDTGYAKGELLLPNAGRADIVVIPTGDCGTTATLKMTGFNIVPAPAMDVDLQPDPPLAIVNFNIVGSKRKPFTISEGEPLRTNPCVDDPVEDLKLLPINPLVDPLTQDPPIGSDNPIITFTVQPPGIDGISAPSFDSGNGDFTNIPPIPTTRYARVEDVLELAIQNPTLAHHSFHLHGFSFQPVKIEEIDKGGNVTQLLYEWNYNEFLDVIDVPPSIRITFRVKIEDRPNLNPNTKCITKEELSGGAIGRWVFHCHIFLHATNGMISELHIIPE